MKKLLGVIAALITIAIPATTQAQEGFYVGGFAGVNFLDIRPKHHVHLDTDAGYALGAVLGYKFCKDFRLEGEIAYRDNGFDKIHSHDAEASLNGHTKTWSFMANGYYDFPVDWVVTPYVGAGIGYDTCNGRIQHNSFKAKFSDKGFAWQLMAGVNYDLADDVIVNLEYKFHSAKAKEDAYDHTLAVGVKRYF